MLIIGVLLLVLAVAAVLAVLLGSAEQATVQAAGLTWSTTVAGVFLLGAAAVVVLAVGLVLIRAGTARRLRHRRESAGSVVSTAPPARVVASVTPRRPFHPASVPLVPGSVRPPTLVRTRHPPVQAHHPERPGPGRGIHHRSPARWSVHPGQPARRVSQREPMP